jgi:hypothetical protein
MGIGRNLVRIDPLLRLRESGRRTNRRLRSGRRLEWYRYQWPEGWSALHIKERVKGIEVDQVLTPIREELSEFCRLLFAENEVMETDQ